MDFFDNHCDTISHLLDAGEDLQNATGHVSLKKGAAFGRWGQVYALFLDDSLGGQAAFERYLRERDCFWQQMQKYAKRICQCRTAPELRAAFAAGKRAAILSVENGALLDGQLDRLMLLQQDGVKLLTLTWYGENAFGFGSRMGGPLKPFGREAVSALARHGIVPDISHLSDEGVADVFSLHAGPVVASHSNVNSVTPHFRNLRDAWIREIVRRRGLIGINLYYQFLRTDAQHAGKEDVRRHLDAFLALGAEDVLAFGTDFDGGRVPQEIGDLTGIEPLYTYLLGCGYSETLLNKVFFENACAFWCRQLGEESV